MSAPMTQASEPAYPVELLTGYSNDANAFPIRMAYVGLTKREAFAMAAMQGRCVNTMGHSSQSIARQAVADADALRAELAKATP